MDEGCLILIHGRSRLLLLLCGMQVVMQVLLQHFYHASTLHVAVEGRPYMLLLLCGSAFLLQLLWLD